jgi:UDP-N-acetylglucosamine:LPS N-acetylglucosamine transferase
MDAPETLTKAARAAHGLGRPDAAERLADLVLATAGDAVGEAAT